MRRHVAMRGRRRSMFTPRTPRVSTRCWPVPSIRWLQPRARCPGLPVGVTTGAWAMADPAARCAAINGWTELPGGVAGMADARPRGSARCGGADWTGGHTAAAGGNDGGK